MRNKLLVEAVGTFLLCLAALVSANPLALAALLCALVYAGAPVGLPHFNPAVSLAVRLRGKIGTRALGAYVAVQFAAAALAASVAGGLLGHDAEHTKGAVDALAESAFTGFGTSATIEFLGAFLLAWVFLMAGTARVTAGNSTFGFAIAVSYLGFVGAFGDFSPTLNPALALAETLQGLGGALLDGKFGTKAFVTETLFLAKVTPRVLAEVAVQHTGASLAAGFFRQLFPEDR